MDEQKQELNQEPQDEPKDANSHQIISLRQVMIGIPLVLIQAVITYWIVTKYVEPRVEKEQPKAQVMND